MPAPALIAAARVTVGGLVHLLIRDGSGNPAFVTGLSSHPSLTVTPQGGSAGAPATVADVVTSDFDAQTLVDYVLLRPASPILDTDGLSVSAAAGWISVAAGPAQAESGVAVANGPAAGRSLLPPASTGPVTMPVGTNGGFPVPNSPGLITSNLCGHAGDWSGNLNHADFAVDVATGLPTSVGTNTALNCLLTFPSSSPDGKNVLNCPRPPGRMTGS